MSRKPTKREVPTTFEARAVDHTGNGTLTDGSVLWEVVTKDFGERIASCTDELGAANLAHALNEALDKWVEVDPSDRVVA